VESVSEVGVAPPVAQELVDLRPDGLVRITLKKTYAEDVLACPKCHRRMRLLAMVEDPASVARFPGILP
jgi:hypothetical protein